MKCKDVLGLLSGYIEGDIEPSQKKRIEAHIARCDSCARELASLKKMISVLNSAEEVEPPADFLNSIHERLERKSWWQRIAGYLPDISPIGYPVKGLVAAAGIFLVLYFTGAFPVKKQGPLHIARKSEVPSQTSVQIQKPEKPIYVARIPQTPVKEKNTAPSPGIQKEEVLHRPESGKVDKEAGFERIVSAAATDVVPAAEKGAGLVLIQDELQPQKEEDVLLEQAEIGIDGVQVAVMVEKEIICKEVLGEFLKWEEKSGQGAAAGESVLSKKGFLEEVISVAMSMGRYKNEFADNMLKITDNVVRDGAQIISEQRSRILSSDAISPDLMNSPGQSTKMKMLNGVAQTIEGRIRKNDDGQQPDADIFLEE